MKGPGIDLFDALKAKLGAVPIIAEDLGVITEDVVQLRCACVSEGMAQGLRHHYLCIIIGGFGVAQVRGEVCIRGARGFRRRCTHTYGWVICLLAAESGCAFNQGLCRSKLGPIMC